MTYKLITGETLEADTFEGIVISMKGNQWEAELTIEEYMERVSGRVKTQSGHDIRFGDAQVFVEDMTKAGYLFPI